MLPAEGGRGTTYKFALCLAAFRRDEGEPDAEEEARAAQAGDSAQGTSDPGGHLPHASQDVQQAGQEAQQEKASVKPFAACAWCRTGNRATRRFQKGQASWPKSSGRLTTLTRPPASE